MLGIRTKLLPRLSRWYRPATMRPSLRRPFPLKELQHMGLSRNAQYDYCVNFFDRFAPESVREHRRYFCAEGRGFGEDAFHAMWYLIFQEYRPRRALEIGVFRGQTITLWKLLARQLGFNCEVGCVSPFTPSGDSVSLYSGKVDYYKDVLINHRHFDLPTPEFCRHFSTDPEARVFVSAHAWDVIYIDGNHDYEIAHQDWEMCSAAVASRGLVVLDDSALDTDYRPPCFATGGHPGPSRLAKGIPPDQFREIFAVGHNRVFQKVS